MNVFVTTKKHEIRILQQICDLLTQKLAKYNQVAISLLENTQLKMVLGAEIGIFENCINQVKTLLNHITSSQPTTIIENTDYQNQIIDKL